MSADYSVAEAARLWTIRIADPSFVDWEDFTVWLEADAAHLVAYDAVVDDEAAALALLRMPAPRAPSEAPIRRGIHWRLGGGAVAAALLGVAAWNFWAPAPAGREIVTAPGQHRTVQLADGSSVTLNGGTRLILDAGKPRHATLVEGEALFQVRHDAEDPFVVTSGSTRLVDAGTVFNVVRDAGVLRVAVAEGAVVYQPGSRQVRLDRGRALEVAEGASPVLSAVAPQQVASWRSSQLVYSDARLDRVARDLSRNLGAPVVAAGGSEKLRFTGILSIEGEPAIALQRIAPLLGVRVTRGVDGWTMLPLRSAQR